MRHSALSWGVSSGPLLLVLAACHGIGDPLEPYYGDGKGPTVSGLDTTSEAGNLGGGTVEISGSGFGDDIAHVTVQFGSQNAVVLAVDDASISVQVPKGPIEGGQVDVAVGTETGFATLDDGYTYQVDETGNLQKETGYIAVLNDWMSCYGGGFQDPQLAGTGCGSFPAVGITGTQGDAEFLTDTFPRLHAYRLGFYAGTDTSPGTWKVEIPGNNFFPEAIDDLRKDVGPVAIRNPLLAGDDFCVDTSYLGTFQYPSGPATNPKTGQVEFYEGASFASGTDALANEEMECNAPDSRTYDLGELEFCQIAYYDEDDHEYASDWPIDKAFFVGTEDLGQTLDAAAPVDVEIDVPEQGIDDVKVKLPEYARFIGTQGFNGGATPYWSVTALESCFDGNQDGVATLDEDAITFSWEPTDVTAEDQGAEAKRMESYVVVSVTELRVGWAFGQGFPARATIRVPDRNDVDEGTGLSSVSIPNWVLYQFPTIDQNFGYTAPLNPGPGQEGTTDWVTMSDDVGYFEIEIHRVTEVSLAASDGTDVVFAYATGDFSFYEWTNPIDAGGCGDCLDSDGDTWVDGDDPDCENGTDEDGNGFGLYSCNDGIDNDDDGDTDAEDDDCGDGFDAESNCHDNIDNDDDGFEDEDDGECTTPGLGQELGEDLPWWQCSNGIDDDKDGWADLEDPGCTSGTAPENDGFRKDLVCNNGIDDDGHGDIDASDPMCWRYGADSATEVPTYGEGACSDGKDNDGDGYTDGNDPGCEFAPFNSEGETSDDVDDHPTTKQCYDGEDNDGDGLTDSQDPACWNASAVPDGNLDDEASNDF